MHCHEPSIAPCCLHTFIQCTCMDTIYLLLWHLRIGLFRFDLHRTSTLFNNTMQKSFCPCKYLLKLSICILIIQVRTVWGCFIVPLHVLCILFCVVIVAYMFCLMVSQQYLSLSCLRYCHGLDITVSQNDYPFIGGWFRPGFLIDVSVNQLHFSYIMVRKCM